MDISANDRPWRRIVELNVLESRVFTRRSNTTLVRISEEDFIANKLDERKLYANSLPERWIHVDCEVDIPSGKQQFSIHMNKDIQNYRYPAKQAYIPLRNRQQKEDELSSKLILLSTIIDQRIEREKLCPPHKYRPFKEENRLIVIENCCIFYCKKCGGSFKVAVPNDAPAETNKPAQLDTTTTNEIVADYGDDHYRVCALFFVQVTTVGPKIDFPHMIYVYLNG